MLLWKGLPSFSRLIKSRCSWGFLLFRCGVFRGVFSLLFNQLWHLQIRHQPEAEFNSKAVRKHLGGGCFGCCLSPYPSVCLSVVSFVCPSLFVSSSPVHPSVLLSFSVCPSIFPSFCHPRDRKMEDRWTDRQTDGQICGRTGGRTDVKTKRNKGRWMDGGTDRDEKMDGNTE